MTDDKPTSAQQSVWESAAKSVAGQTPQLPKRFYKLVAVDAAPAKRDGDVAYRILLDGRPVRTPAKQHLAVRGRALADALAEEWQRQTKVIDPASMPLTRLVNTALDGVAGRESEVRADIVAYAGTDLVCYMAGQPPDLLERQQAAWAPVRSWIETEFGVPLRVSYSVAHVTQVPRLAPAIDAAFAGFDAMSLAALHVMTTLTGSAMLALCCARGRVTVGEAWVLAHVDEDYQASKWGDDAVARRRRDARFVEMDAAGRLLVLSGAD